jgi:glycosyltransferase involved in cell wall biosynthesis
MSYGLPVVAGSNGGAADVIGDGVCGRIVRSMDAGGLADALEQLAGDPAAAQRMGEEAVRRAVASHTWDGVAARMAEVLEARL